MKLRNKKTGEIKPAEAREDGIYLYDETTEQWYKYELDLLAKWWEYYEEPKEYWRITDLGEVKSIRLDQHHQNIKKSKQIGNYFETKEEAEKAVEKLKAWKRLKDRGFKFGGYTALGLAEIHFMVDWEDIDVEQHKKDMDLLFGGEEL